MKEHSLGENFFCLGQIVRPDGFNGVHVIAPDGKRIARFKCRKFVRIRVLVAAKKNRLFMAAGQSLYSLYVNTEGADA